ncbi:hypothetical protein [Streptomyces sp. NPDC006333]|uniref:hypothetical protein n=1 Tax=Streptomyces sp. NPDC006333 TaxID=3156753 RepID=UPI0033B2CA12
MSEQLSRWYRGRLVAGSFGPFEAEELEALERELGLPLPASGIQLNSPWSGTGSTKGVLSCEDSSV